LAKPSTTDAFQELSPEEVDVRIAQLEKLFEGLNLRDQFLLITACGILLARKTGVYFKDREMIEVGFERLKADALETYDQAASLRLH
jgi:hypothetical protein